MIHVTGHAIMRYQERISPRSTEDEVRARLSGKVFQMAALFGAGVVKLGSGHRVVIRNNTVVTVLPAKRFAYARTPPDASGWK